MNAEITKLLEEMQAYIERMEIIVEEEWGSYRPLEELVKLGEMPELYTKVTNLLNPK
jgi:hypothetical protein